LVGGAMLLLFTAATAALESFPGFYLRVSTPPFSLFYYSVTAADP